MNLFTDENMKIIQSIISSALSQSHEYWYCLCLFQNKSILLINITSSKINNTKMCSKDQVIWKRINRIIKLVDILALTGYTMFEEQNPGRMEEWIWGSWNSLGVCLFVFIFVWMKWMKVAQEWSQRWSQHCLGRVKGHWPGIRERRRSSRTAESVRAAVAQEV